MSDEEIEKYIATKIENNKSANITLGVSFNKTCPRQMKLLRKALKSSDSFSGLVKEMLIQLSVDENTNKLNILTNGESEKKG